MKHLAYILVLIVAPAWGLASASGQTRPAAPATGPTTQATTQPATLVTLRAQPQPARDALEELARQAGASLSIPPEIWATEMPKVTLTADRRPFWEVVTEVCQQAGVTVAANNQPNVLAIGPSQPASTLVPAGPLLARMGYVTVVDKINYAAGDQRTRRSSLSVSLQCEPGMRVMAFEPLVLIEAMADNGDRLTLASPPSTPNVSRMRISDTSVWNVPVTLPDVPVAVRRFDAVRLSAAVTLQTKSATIEFADLAKAETRTVEGWKVSFRQMTKPNEQYHEVRLAVEAVPHGMETIDIGTTLRMLDKDGVQLQNGGLPRRGGVGELQAGFFRRGMNGQPVGEAAKLVWDLPVRMVKLTVPLELKNIDLESK